MKTYKVLARFAAAIMLCLTLAASSAAGQQSEATPLVQVGPQADQLDAADTNYRLFTCQVVGLSPNSTCYDPYQIRHAYNIDALINAGLDGKGKTIVIVDAFQSPNIVQQLNTYDTFYGLPGLNGLGNPNDSRLGSFTQVAPDGLTAFDSTSKNMLGWAEEISLDVLWAHAIAPGANVVLVLAKSNRNDDLLSALRYAVNNRLGDVISQSYGENEGCVDASMLGQVHDVYALATLEGITIFASSGDSGSAQGSCDGKSGVEAVSWPASDPLVTAVGGTELHAARYCLASLGCDPAANPAPGTYESEVVWNEFASGFGGTGGGFSVVFDEPSYQKGTIHGGKQLGVPDVSYSAAVGHGVLTYLNIPGIPAGYYRFGGTSAGSPQWAALAAIIDELSGSPVGFINKALFHIGQVQSNYAASFFDITTGDNAFPGLPGFSAGPGWDAATGLGSPNAPSLASNLVQSVSPGDGVSAMVQSVNGRAHAGSGTIDPH